MADLLAVHERTAMPGDPADPIIEFSDVTELIIRDQLALAGSLPESTVTVPVLDADGEPNAVLAELQSGRVVVVRDETGSVPIHSFLIEKRNRVVYDSVDPRERKWTVTGRTLPGVLSDAKWRPTLGYGLAPWAATRSFSVASPEYVPVGWEACQVLGLQRNPPLFYRGKPSGWFDPDAAFICPTVDTDISGHIGHWYTSGTFTLAEDTAVVFIMGADNKAIVWIDGFPLITVGTYLGFDKTHRVTVFLTAGVHKITAKVSNYVDGGADPPWGMGDLLVGDPTAFIFSSYRIDAAGRIGGLVIHTDDEWPILAYPESAPGMTVGQVAGIGLAEWQDEGILTYVTPSWADDVDTNENDWDVQETITVPVGGSFLDTLDAWSLRLAEYGMPPDRFRLDLYRHNERGTHTSVEYSPANQNLVHVAVDDLDDSTDCLMVLWGGPTFRWPESGGTRMATLSTNAESLTEAQGIAAAFLDLHAGEVSQITPAIRPRAGASPDETPGTGYWIGDWVSTDDGDGLVEDRAISVVGTWTDNTKWDWAIALRNKHLDDLDALSIWIERMSPGGAGGRAPSGPALPPPPFGNTVSSSELSFSVPDPIPVAVSLKTDAVSSSGNLFGVLAILNTASSSGSTDFTYLVDGIDVLGGAGSLGVGENMKFFNVNLGSSQYTQWLEGLSSRLSMAVTAVGTGAQGLVVKGVVIE